ncbi:MAG: tetratricopeptide repeat protein [Chloroflexota bacterium]
MKNSRIYTLLVVMLLLLVGSYGWTTSQNRLRETAVTPETASVGLEQSTTSSHKTTDELIAFWQARVENSPSDYISMTHLGNSYINKARESADLSNYTTAGQTLGKALDLNPDYLPAKAYLAAVHFAQHEFEKALALAETVYSEDPSALLALAMIGDVHIELGNYEEASAAYETLAEANDSPAVLSRMARLSFLNGHTETAVYLLTQAKDAAVEAGYRGESLAWYQYQLGELYIQKGDFETAVVYFDAALETYPGYYLPIEGKGHVANTLGNTEEAIAFYEQIITQAPQPEYLATLGNLYLETNQPELAATQFDLIDALADDNHPEAKLFSHQVAVVYLEEGIHLDWALEVAESSLEVHQDIYSYDLYAWALYKNGRFEEAAQAIEEALKLNTQDAELFTHAGEIYSAIGQQDNADELFAKAESLAP